MHAHRSRMGGPHGLSRGSRRARLVSARPLAEPRVERQAPSARRRELRVRVRQREHELQLQILRRHRRDVSAGRRAGARRDPEFVRRRQRRVGVHGAADDDAGHVSFDHVAAGRDRLGRERHDLRERDGAAQVRFGVCAPNGPPICITHFGEIDCPAGTPYTNRRVRFASANSTRACNACTCASPTGAACSWQVQYARDTSDCTAGTVLNVTDTSPLQCNAPLGAQSSAKLVASTPVQGTCVAAGGGVGGDASPGEPTTICCAP